MTTLHDFGASLKESQRLARESWWLDIYTQKFPDLERISEPVTDLEEQKAGIDRKIYLTNGEVRYVDEKVRPKFWNDILFEVWSDHANRVPGWIMKPLRCDYIAYAFLSTQVCYMFAFQDMRRMWLRHGERWYKNAKLHRDGYDIVKAPNPGYVTVSVAVPLYVVLQSLGETAWTGWFGKRKPDGTPY